MGRADLLICPRAALRLMRPPRRAIRPGGRGLADAHLAATGEGGGGQDGRCPVHVTLITYRPTPWAYSPTLPLLSSNISRPPADYPTSHNVPCSLPTSPTSYRFAIPLSSQRFPSSQTSANLSRSPSTFPDLPRLPQIYPDLSRPSAIYPTLPLHSWTSLNLHIHFKIPPNSPYLPTSQYLPRPSKIYPNLLRHTPTSLDIPIPPPTPTATLNPSRPSTAGGGDEYIRPVGDGSPSRHGGHLRAYPGRLTGDTGHVAAPGPGTCPRGTGAGAAATLGRLGTLIPLVWSVISPRQRHTISPHLFHPPDRFI